MSKFTNKIQKVISIIVILVMTMCVMPIYGAEDSSTFRVSSVKVYKSNTDVSVQISVNASQLVGKANMSFTLSYDNTVFDVSTDKFIFNDALALMQLTKQIDTDKGEIKVIGFSTHTLTNEDIGTDLSIKIADVTFTLKGDPDYGDYPVKFLNANTTKIVGSEAVSVPVNTVDGVITIARKSSGSKTDDGTAYYNPTTSATPTSTPTPTPTPSEQPTVSPSPTPGQSADKFKDLGNHEWAKEAIDALVKAGIVNGTSETTYEPDRTITRAEFCKLVVTAFGLKDEDSTKSYNDVASDAWYNSFVKKAAKAGIVTGDDEGNFKPNASITRQEMAAMLVRAFKAAGIEISSADETFADGDKISEWAKTYVSGLKKMGIVGGRGNNEFAPLESLTRAESAKVIYTSLNFLKLLTNQAE